MSDDSLPPRRPLWGRLDTAAKKIMAVVVAVGAIAGSIQGVRALLPKHAQQPEERASLGSLRIHVEPLRSFTARERLIADRPPVGSSGGRVLIASNDLVADAAVLAQTSTQTVPTQTVPTQTVPTQTVPTETATLPSTIVGTTSIPGTPSGKGVLCVEETSVSAETPTLTSTTPSTSTNPGSPPCQIVYAIQPNDLEKSVSQLKREAGALGQQMTETYALPVSCDTRPAPDTCPLATGIHPRSVTHKRANRVISIEAAKLAVIREELRQLRHTKVAKGPGGKRDALGVQLDYRLRVCGFGGRSVRVFWTLFDTNQPPRIPYYWDSNRLANSINRKSSRCQSVFPSFWVPIPATKGRFTVALSVYDQDGVRRGPLVESVPFSS